MKATSSTPTTTSSVEDELDHRAWNRPAPSRSTNCVPKTDIDNRYLIRLIFVPDGKVGQTASR